MIEGAGVGDMDAGEVAAPEESAGLLLDGEDLSFGGMGVHSASAADGEVFDGSFIAADPFQFQGGC